VVSLIVFLLMIVPFFQGNQKYLYLQYIEPLRGANPPKSVSALWLNFDCVVFSIEAGLFFVMARSLSAHRWQQFYGAIIFLLSLDLIWAVVERHRGAAVPGEWIWFDGLVALALAGFILADWFLIRYDRENHLNRYCFWGVSILTILCLIFGYFFEIDYVIE
jgi:hypothetical protein